MQVQFYLVARLVLITMASLQATTKMQMFKNILGTEHGFCDIAEYPVKNSKTNVINTRYNLDRIKKVFC